MKMCEKLDLSVNYIGNIETLWHLTKINYLNISHNKITTIQPLGSLTHLSHLDASYN